MLAFFLKPKLTPKLTPLFATAELPPQHEKVPLQHFARCCVGIDDGIAIHVADSANYAMRHCRIATITLKG